MALFQGTAPKCLYIRSSVVPSRHNPSIHHRIEESFPPVICFLEIVEKVILSVCRTRAIHKIPVHTELLVRFLKIEIVRDWLLVIEWKVLQILSL